MIEVLLSTSLSQVQVNELRARLGERSREVSADAESIYASASSQVVSLTL